MSSPSRAGSSIGYTENIIRGFQFHSINSDSSSTHPITTGNDGVDQSGYTADCLHIGPRGHGAGMNCIYPSDLLPFSRRPLFLIVDGDNSKAFKVMSGAEKGEPAAILLSPVTSLPTVESSKQPSGSLFTSFLTSPLQTFTMLVGFTGSDVDKDLYNRGEKLLQSSLNKFGSLLAASESLDPVWAQILTDPFLRRLLLRFVFCRAVLSIYSQSFDKIEFLPECMPCLPEIVSPTSTACQNAVLEIANLFGVSGKFLFSDGTLLVND